MLRGSANRCRTVSRAPMATAHRPLITDHSPPSVERCALSVERFPSALSAFQHFPRPPPFASIRVHSRFRIEREALGRGVTNGIRCSTVPPSPTVRVYSRPFAVQVRRSTSHGARACAARRCSLSPSSSLTPAIAPDAGGACRPGTSPVTRSRAAFPAAGSTRAGEGCPTGKTGTCGPAGSISRPVGAR